jgi:hypothetical protein
MPQAHLPNSPDSPAQRALGASTVALIVAAGCLVLFIPPLSERVLGGGVVFLAVNGLALATAMLLHWIFLGIAVRRMGRSVFGWLALAILFPVGSAAALILLSWFSDEAAPANSMS